MGILRALVAGAFSRLPGRPISPIVVATALLLSSTVAAASGEESAGAIRVLMLGDSLTAGYGVAPRAALPVRLEAALRELGFDVAVINAGVSGDTSAGGLARLEWALADDPHAVIVALGANDALRALDPEITRDNLDRLTRALAERGLPVLIAGMLAPRNLGADYVARFDAMYAEIAARHGALLYPFLLEGVASVVALNQSDGIHPNEAGVDEIVSRILPSVLCLLGRVSHPAGSKALPDSGACPEAGAERQA